jgi:broad specificity phosphatase PhoE
MAAFDEIRAAGRTTAVVSHGNLTSLLLRRLGWAMDFQASLRLSNPDVFEIRTHQQTIIITRLWQ